MTFNSVVLAVAALILIRLPVCSAYCSLPSCESVCSYEDRETECSPSTALVALCTTCETFQLGECSVKHSCTGGPDLVTCSANATSVCIEEEVCARSPLLGSHAYRFSTPCEAPTMWIKSADCDRMCKTQAGTDPKGRKCHAVQCQAHCRHGFQADKRGCPTCRCLVPKLESDNSDD